MAGKLKVYSHYSEYPMAKWRWPSFTPAEIACRDGTLAVDEDAMNKLQSLRDWLGEPMIVNSAYRSPAHNKRVGGAARSKHLEAKAFDISMANHDPGDFEKQARSFGFTGFGFYPRHNFIHIDTGPAREWGERWWPEGASLLPATYLINPDEDVLIEGVNTMIDQKPWYQSNTIWGALVALLGSAGAFIGVPIDDATQAETVTAVLQITSGVGALWAIWGRLRADRIIR